LLRFWREPDPDEEHSHEENSIDLFACRAGLRCLAVPGSTALGQIKKMRVVPFDLRSFAQLAASSFGSIATLLPLLHFDEHTASIFEAIGKFLGHLSGKG
jgi:hypothetical protein